MTTISPTTVSAVQMPFDRAGFDEAQLAAASFLARYSGHTLEAGVPLRDVQTVAGHSDPRTTTIYDQRRQNFDRHSAYVVVASVAVG